MKGLQIVILGGGSGSRFWPVSRAARPKQFLSLSPTGESLIQATARRVRPMLSDGAVWVVANRAHEGLVRGHIPDATVIGEPIGRNTAASIGLAAVALSKRDPDAVLLVLPADHVVTHEAELRATFDRAVRVAASQPYLVTVGITPTSANTAYGYILRGAELAEGCYSVARFFEKPNRERAVGYFESGRYFWNSGMFAWRVSVILDAIRDHMPQLFEGLERISSSLGGPRESATVDEVFAGLESLSIDFGVLEHSRSCAVVAGEPFGWNDIGSWDAWADIYGQEQEGNLTQGDAVFIDSSSCIVHSPHRLTAVVGATDLVIIDSGDALLVAPRSRVQDVRKVVEELRARGRGELV